jgi:amino acid adenylation domain-containing protein/FkbH-like protein
MERRARDTSEPKTISVVGTFTIEPLLGPLKFWMDKLEIAAAVELAPYAQVMQELLDPLSGSSRTVNGFNVLLIRIQDWLGEFVGPEDVDRSMRRLWGVVQELTHAVGALRRRTPAPILVLFTPSCRLPAHFQKPLADLQAQVVNELRDIPDVHCWTETDLSELYPVLEYEDGVSDRVGHIPYTAEYFAAMATFLARKISLMVRAPFKVIVVDCDNTLWSGVCGEDGPAGVVLTDMHLEFQRLLVKQHDAGRLICLCSKNNLADVHAVFEQRSEMPLREELLVGSYVNWESKPTNLLRLAKELDLSLESFVFIDDNPLECAQVKDVCPSVLTICFPQKPDEILHFLKHVWAFDLRGITEDARNRTKQYQQNRLRAHAREQANDLSGFLESLNVELDVAPMKTHQLGRVAELVQRTNQFNLTGIRRSIGEIDALRRLTDTHVVVAHVRDRFGDYGLVAALVLRCEHSTIDVDTFVMSCRALGRGAEHRLANALARIARQWAATSILFRYRRTTRNLPAWKFLKESFGKFRAPADDAAVDDEVTFRVPIEYAETLACGGLHEVVADETESQQVAAAAQQRISHAWHEIGLRLSRPSDVVREFNLSVSRATERSAKLSPARTETEAAVAAIWCEVLGVPSVGIQDDFFRLGGDSILAVRVVSRIASVLGRELPLHEIFERPTVEAIAAKLLDSVNTDSFVSAAPRAALSRLSWAQQRLWFIEELDGESAAYHVPLALRLTGALNRSALQGSLNALVARHEVLRTNFVEIDGEPWQKVNEDAHLTLKRVDLSVLPSVRQEIELQELLRREIAQSFDLRTGPLIRGALIPLGPAEHVLLLTMHHIVSDGWSLTVLLDELSELYSAHCEQRPTAMAPLPIQYADYARWQRKWLAEAGLKSQLEFWVGHLANAPEVLDLPTDRPRPAVMRYSGASVPFALDEALAQQLKALSSRFDLTLAMTMYAAWLVLLHRFSGQRDMVVGVPVANRRRTELEALIGFFVNTLPVRVQLESEWTVIDVLREVKKRMLDAYAHQDVPFEKIVESLRLSRSRSQTPIFQVMFVFQNARRWKMRFSNIEVKEEPVPVLASQFDMVLTLQESGDGIAGGLKYSSEIFDETTVRSWVASYEALLRHMVRDPRSSVARLSLMDDVEWLSVVVTPNATQAEWPRDRLIHQLFEEQVPRVSDTIAVVEGTRSLTYAALDDRAEHLAAILHDMGAHPGGLVALYFERSLEMVIALLATLKSGAAYLPLDPSSPPDRMAHILADAGPRILMTTQELLGRLPDSDAKTLTLGAQRPEILMRMQRIRSEWAPPMSRDLAYVIYTSGSTGSPKGVMIEHRSIVNYAWHASQQFDVIGGEGSLICTSMSYDLMLTGLYPVLITGRTVRLCAEYRSMPELEESLLHATALAPLKLTPSHETMLEGALRRGELNGRVRALVFGGEPLQPDVIRTWRTFAPNCRIFNHYGPTEATVGCVVHEVCDVEVDGPVPIGRPISNVEVYILDKCMQPVPHGATGEIYIAGLGIARGYLNRPDLTAERFMANPFSSDSSSRVYRTGDLARRRRDGAIECLGRNDDQVKIRGHRIELGEIEAQLLRHTPAKHAAVLVHQDSGGEKRLIAYVVPVRTNDGRPLAPTAETFRSVLVTRLPGYMVPSAILVLDQLPLTANGKLDRRALRELNVTDALHRPHEAPQGLIEEALAQIWKELLNLEQIGRDEDFFRLGGHSLLAMRLISRVREGLDVDLHVRTLFDAPTISQLAAVIEGDSVGTGSTLDAENVIREIRADIGRMEPETVKQRIAELERELVNRTMHG